MGRSNEVEVKKLNIGSTVATLRLAVSDDYTNKLGEKVERTVFLDVETWDRLAENCAQSLHKGSGVLVEGRLQMDTWTTPEGEKRSKLKVRANRVQFLDPPPARKDRKPDGEKQPDKDPFADDTEPPF